MRELEKLDLSSVTRVGFDETFSRRGHDYVSISVGLDTRRVIFATAGKDSSVVACFRAFLTEHGGRPENIRQLCCDMSPAFVKGAREHFPGAKLGAPLKKARSQTNEPSSTGFTLSLDSYK